MNILSYHLHLPRISCYPIAFDHRPLMLILLAILLCSLYLVSYHRIHVWQYPLCLKQRRTEMKRMRMPSTGTAQSFNAFDCRINCNARRSHSSTFITVSTLFGSSPKSPWNYRTSSFLSNHLLVLTSISIFIISTLFCRPITLK